MLLWQHYSSGCQLAVVLMGRLLLHTSESSASPDHSRNHPVALDKSRERKGLASHTPVSSLAFQVLDKESLERSKLGKQKKCDLPAPVEVPGWKPHPTAFSPDIQYGLETCLAQVPGGWDPHYRLSLALYCLSTLNFQVRSFLTIFCVSSSKTATVSTWDNIMTRKHLFDPFVTICHVP